MGAVDFDHLKRMKLAIGLMVVGALIVTYDGAEAKAKPQTVKANVNVVVGETQGAPEEREDCAMEDEECRNPEDCCRLLWCGVATSVNGTDKWYCMPISCVKEGELCTDEEPCCDSYQECVDGICLKKPTKPDDCVKEGEPCISEGDCCGPLHCVMQTLVNGTEKFCGEWNR